MKKDTGYLITPKCQEKINSTSLSKPDKELLKKVISEQVAYIPSSKDPERSVLNKRIVATPGYSLSAEEEKALFLQMNYARYRLCQLRQKIMQQAQWDLIDVQQMLHYYNNQMLNRSTIVSCNMGLVISMAQRVNYPGVEFTDLVSEGSMALLRAVENFDSEKGFKFSTYACQAIFKSFSRAAKKCYTYHRRFPVQLDSTYEKDDKEKRRKEEYQTYLEEELQIILSDNLADLSDIEKSVIQMRFPVGENSPESPLTLKKVGEKHGLTKERIRQIQNKALDKLKVIAQERSITDLYN